MGARATPSSSRAEVPGGCHTGLHDRGVHLLQQREAEGGIFEK